MQNGRHFKRNARCIRQWLNLAATAVWIVPTILPNTGRKMFHFHIHFFFFNFAFKFKCDLISEQFLEEIVINCYSCVHGLRSVISAAIKPIFRALERGTE